MKHALLHFSKEGFKKVCAFGCLKKNEKPKKVPNWEKNGNPQNTNWDQTLTPKSSKTPISCSLKMALQEGVQFLTLQGVQLLTL